MPLFSKFVKDSYEAKDWLFLEALWMYDTVFPRLVVC